MCIYTYRLLTPTLEERLVFAYLFCTGGVAYHANNDCGDFSLPNCWGLYFPVREMPGIFVEDVSRKD